MTVFFTVTDHLMQIAPKCISASYCMHFTGMNTNAESPGLQK